MLNVKMFDITGKTIYNNKGEFIINLQAFLSEEKYGYDAFIEKEYTLNIDPEKVIIDFYDDFDEDYGVDGEVTYVKVANTKELEILKKSLISQIENHKQQLLKETGVKEEDIRFWV